MLNVLSLGYVGFGASDLTPWRRFADRVLAIEPQELSGPDGLPALGLRIDDRAPRLLIATGAEAGVFFGFELADADALATAEQELARAGFASRPATDAELAFRRVAGMRHFTDPAGYRIELYRGLEHAPSPFVPTRPMGGYRTGALGLGHAVIVVPDVEPSRRLYCDVLGFRLSDYITDPNLRVFLHCNARHHSLALAERQGHGIAHLMVEMNEFDDVGRAYDIVQQEWPDRIFSTFGRHSNDHMVSFYVKTPSGFPLEIGWGGRLVDDATWQAGEIFGPSLWGHDRAGSPPDARAVADRQRDHALAMGLRAPMPGKDES